MLNRVEKNIIHEDSGGKAPGAKWSVDALAKADHLLPNKVDIPLDRFCLGATRCLVHQVMILNNQRYTMGGKQGSGLPNPIEHLKDWRRGGQCHYQYYILAVNVQSIGRIGLGTKRK